MATVGLAELPELARPLAGEDLVLQEVDGFVAGEAEHFVAQDKADVRAWYRTSSVENPGLKPDADPVHAEGAARGAYLEALPDTRKNHSEKLITGENFSNEPGKLAILSYRIRFDNPGRYYVWARTHSTGTEDNGIHVGLNGEWPESGRRMQWTAKKRWAWGSKQRTLEVHGGVPGILYLDIAEAGEHTIQFSMREDGFEFDAWIMTTDKDFSPPGAGAPESVVSAGTLPAAFPVVKAAASLRGKDGDGSVQVSGELKTWHKVTLDLAGPWVAEDDDKPNPFTDLRMDVVFLHIESQTEVVVPGYFAADGNAAESSANSGNVWRAHIAPGLAGQWQYQVRFRRGENVSIGDASGGEAFPPYDGITGTIDIVETDKSGRDLRAHGVLNQAPGTHHLQFAGSGDYFLKAGADAPETFLGYADFDGTCANSPKKCPLKTWEPHVQDWRPGDPTWKGGKGKGMIGAINYLAGTGCNAFSFLSYNAGGDGDNVWPFVDRDDPLHYDCSKLDQWGIVFDHAGRQGMFLHFKLQETENDDNRLGHKKKSAEVPTALDGGKLGIERKLYLRELVARFGHCLALNWNLGEENTQTTEEQIAVADWLGKLSPGRPIVIHTYPDQQEEVYAALMDRTSEHPVRGASVQNSNVSDCHHQTVRWVTLSAEKGVPWLVAFDEPGNASEGTPADPGYPEMPDGFNKPSIDTVRKHALWGTLMGGGWGIEYYFGYKLPQNDLLCEDWRSRAKTWEWSAIALGIFSDAEIPFWEMAPSDHLVGNPKHDNSAYCLAKAGEVYLVYLPEGGERGLNLDEAQNDFVVTWIDPLTGKTASTTDANGGGPVQLAAPDSDQDWLAVVRKK